MNRIDRELPPPPGLERRVVDRLASRGLLRRPRGSRWLVPLAAGLVGVLAGWALDGASRSPTGAPANGSDTGLYLLLVSADPPAGPPAAERVELYRRWARRLAAEGRLESARKLTSGGVAIEGAAAPARPVAIDEATPTGYFLVRASSLDEAIEIARGSPHAELGGRVTVRPIDPV